MNVLLLPGSLCDARLFDDQVAGLQSAGHRVVVAELRPHISIESMAEHCLGLAGEQFAEVDGEPAEFAVVGLSLGAIVAAEMADRAPGAIAAVGLLATNLAAPSQTQLAQRHRWEATVRTGKLWQVLAQEMIPVLSSDPDRHGRLIFAMAEAAGSAGFLSENQALLNRPDRRGYPARYLAARRDTGRPGAALIACGDQDLVCPPALHRDLAARTPGAQLEVIADAGHLATIDQPQPMTDLLVGWLDQTKTNQSNNSVENQTQEGIDAYQHA